VSRDGVEVLEDSCGELVPGEEVEVPAEDHGRGVAQVLEELACLWPDAFGVSRALMSVVAFVCEFEEVAAFVCVEPQGGCQRVEDFL
jgi:hypothetical protein